MSDLDLLKLLKTKSQEAFKTLYYQYYKLVFFQAYMILKNKEDSEDVSQMTFIKFWDNIDQLDEDTSIKRYISVIARNKALDLYRQKSNRKEINDEELLNNIPSHDSNSLELALSFNKALTQEESKIVALKIYFDYSFKEIGEEMSLTLGQVQAKYYNALEKLKPLYKEVK